MVCYIHTCQTFTSLHRLSLLAAFAQSSPPPVFLGAGAQNHACSHHYPPLSEYIHTSSTTIVSPAPPSLALALSLSLLHHHIIISVNFEKMSVPMRAAALITITNDTTPNTGEEEARRRRDTRTRRRYHYTRSKDAQKTSAAAIGGGCALRRSCRVRVIGCDDERCV